MIDKEQEAELNRQFIIDNFRAAAKAVYNVADIPTIDAILDEIERGLEEQCE